jgi:hypothetical protein
MKSRDKRAQTFGANCRFEDSRGGSQPDFSVCTWWHKIRERKKTQENLSFFACRLRVVRVSFHRQLKTTRDNLILLKTYR